MQANSIIYAVQQIRKKRKIRYSVFSDSRVRKPVKRCFKTKAKLFIKVYDWSKITRQKNIKPNFYKTEEATEPSG